MKARLLAVALAASALSAPAHAALPQQSGTVDLATQVDSRIDGIYPGAAVYQASQPIGDFNGDGIGDIATGVLTNAGIEVWVIFGRSAAFDIDLPEVAPGPIGVRVVNGSTGLLGLAAAGDTNDDGYTDLIVTNRSENGNAGSAWVVRGRAATSTINVALVGFGGFRVNGSAANGGDGLGDSAAPAGDVDKDGLDDVIIGAPTTGAGNEGAAVVIFGKATDGTIDASGALASQGIRLTGPAAGANAGQHVAGVGDVNGDGTLDVAVGAPSFDGGPNGADAGAVWVVFGHAAPSTLNLGALGVLGFRIEGPDDTGYLGPVTGAGDINGDGRADVAVGSPGDDRLTVNGGSASIVYGKATQTPVNTAALGAAGRQIVQSNVEEGLGNGLAGPADFNGDGIPDIAIGAPLGRGADVNLDRGLGKIYILYGRPGDEPDLNVTAFSPADGVRLAGSREETGSSPNTTAGSEIGRDSFLGFGDVNADGRPDLVAGTSYQSGSGGGPAYPGNVFVTLGFGVTSFSFPSALPPLPATPADVRRTGPATFSVAPALPAGVTLDPATGTIGGAPSACGISTHTLRLTDLAGSADRPFALGAECPPTPPGTGPGTGPGTTPQDRTAPLLSRGSLKPRRVKRGRRARTTARFTVSEPGRLHAQVLCAKLPKRGAKLRACRKLAKKFVRRTVKAGAGRLVISLRGVAKGRYVVVLVAFDAAGNGSRALQLRLDVR